MSEQKEETMIGALRKSIDSILKAPEGEREALLNKSFEEFEAALGQTIGEATNEAFAMGQQDKIGEFSKVEVEGDPELAKSMSSVATFANALQSAESAVNVIENGYTPNGDEDMSPAAVAMMREWIKLGASILQMMIAEFTAEAAEEAAEAADEAKKADATGELQKADGDFNAKAEEVMGLAKQLEEKVAKFDSLFKAAPPPVEGEEGAVPAEGAEGEQPEMDPLEVIGRLAAAILVQVEALMPGEEGEAEAEADAGGATVEDDATAQKSDKAEGLEKAADEGKQPEKKVEPQKDEEALKKAADLQKENDSLRERLAKAEQDAAKAKEQPEPAKGVLRAVDKNSDSALNKGDGLDLEKEAERLAKMSEQERSLELTKMALKRPIPA